jgi:hypothetical protein
VLVVLIILAVLLVLVMAFTLFGAGPSRVRRRVIITPVRRRRRTIVEDVVPRGEVVEPRTTRRVVEYDE